MNVNDFYYDLPEELIAQQPSDERDQSRLMCLDPRQQRIEHKQFYDLISYLQAGDCLVLNDTRVIPARLIGHKRDSEARVEFLLLKRLGTYDWEVMVYPGKRVREKAEIVFIPTVLEAEVRQVLPNGNRIVRFYFEGIWEEVLEQAGQTPLPPYIHEELKDKQRYQTIYAKKDGSAAAPTAGLHFTKYMLYRIQKKGVKIVYLTLHVGIGTFRPVKTQNVEEHHMHAEYYDLPAESAQIIHQTQQDGGRVISVGTTSTRVLESVYKKNGRIMRDSGWTDIFIYPGYTFNVVDALITNFHLPESTLLMLVSAFAGSSFIMHAYETAVQEKYRFFSFGDAMFIEKRK